MSAQPEWRVTKGERDDLCCPVRLQLSRRNGFSLKAHSRAVNGLDAINVARPSFYGNPFVVGSKAMPWLALAIGYRGDRQGQRRAAVALYRAWITGNLVLGRELTGGGDLIEYEGGLKCSTLEVAQLHGLYFAMINGGFDIPEAPKDFSGLHGKNLACFCKLTEPCHADVLLELANR
jgi:hypothetical protein